MEEPQQWNRPLAGPRAQQPQNNRPLPPAPGVSQWAPQPSPQPIAPNWNQGPPPSTSIADQWSRRQGQTQPAPAPVSPGQFRQQQGQVGAIGWQSPVQYAANPGNSAPQWQQTPSRVSREGDLPPPIPISPDNPVPKWSQPADNGQAQYVPAPQNNQAPPPANPVSGQQWPNPPLLGGDMFSGPAYVHFRIDHTVDPRQPPLRYQYSY